MCTHCMVHPQVVDVEEDSKMEDVFDESTLVPSANSSLTAAGGGVSQTGATTAEGAKVKKTIVRKRYKWTDEIRCVAFFRMSSSGGGRRQRGEIHVYLLYIHYSIILSRKLLCEVVRIKVESEESMNRINRVNGEDVVNVSLAIM